MEIDRLRTFIKVAETGSLSAASDLLRIAQPALSRQVRLLETEVGQQLFTRSRHGMQLTAAGSELLQRVSGLVRALEQSFEDVRAFSDRPRGAVTIGIVPTVSAVVAAPLAERVRSVLPDVRLRFLEGHTGHILDWMHHHEVDFGLIYGPAADLHVEALPIRTDELVLVAPAVRPGFPDAIAPEDLGRWPLVLPPPHHGLRLVVERAIDRTGAAIDVAAEATSFVTILQLVAAGIGLAVLPRSAVALHPGAASLVLRPFTPSLVREVILARPHGASPSRAAAALAPILADETARRLG